MKSRLLALMMLFATLSTAPVVAEDTKLPDVVILATGGTIAGAAEAGTDAGYQSGQVGVDILLAAVPDLAKLANCKGEQIANVGSQNMSDEIWLKLAKRVNELARTDVNGIVITHGTDTMVDTARTLAEKVPDKTIVLTGAMIPIAFGSSDGLFNLGGAITAVQVLPPGVYVTMNGRVFPWDRVRKNRSTGIFEALE